MTGPAFWDRSGNVARAVAQGIPGCERGFGRHIALGFLDDAGCLEAGIVYHNYQPEAGVIEVSAASAHRRWTTRERIALIFNYPLRDAGCRVVVMRVSEHNAPVRRLMRNLGADEYLIPALRGPDEAEAIYTLRREVWTKNPISESRRGEARRT